MGSAFQLAKKLLNYKAQKSKYKKIIFFQKKIQKGIDNNTKMYYTTIMKYRKVFQATKGGPAMNYQETLETCYKYSCILLVIFVALALIL